MANQNYIFNNSSDALCGLLEDLVYKADEVGSRNGRTKELTHIGITLRHPWQRALLLPTRKANLAAQIAETMWVLAGRDDMEFLTHYLPRAKDYSDDGKVWRGAYGPRIRGNGFSKPDQVKFVVDTLKADPLSRQAVISIYDAGKDCGVVSKDIPCNDFLQFTSRLGKLDLHVYIRSNDAIWGWSGINAFEWSALQEVVAGLLGIEMGRLHFSVGSFHLYEYHWEKAAAIVQQGPMNDTLVGDNPRFDSGAVASLEHFDRLVVDWFKVEQAIREGYDEVVEGGPSVAEAVADFPEPMMQSWLRVLQWWWTGDFGYLDELQGTRLALAARLAVQPKNAVAELPVGDPFLVHVKELHESKAKAYGDSWKRRGEMLGIMANVARKLDRFGRPDIDGETAADTAIDLMVYLGMYRLWMTDQGWAPDMFSNDFKRPLSDHVVEPLAATLTALNNLTLTEDPPEDFLEKRLADRFEDLEQMVMDSNDKRYILVEAMLTDAFVLARRRWNSK